ncbi:MAG: PP2C family protein-serine/threonine phosphatase [Oscillospiraceae bacterium]|nr:PP2C family protein-serine/threonine phosphatase [Oscillospiraceae bacterium]
MKKNALFTQITIFFLIGLTLTALLSGAIMRRIADRNVLRERDVLSSGILEDVEKSMKEYQSYEWVFDYLITHSSDGLDLEYDSSEKTIVKEAEFLGRQPGLTLTGVTAEQLDKMSPEDQKIFAEVIYNHWMRRLNDMKQAYDATYLYIVAVDDNYVDGTFLLTASDGTRERGTGFDNAYILGKQVQVTPDQAETFRNLTVQNDRFVYSQDYADRYRYLFRIDEMNVITGMTFEITSIRSAVENQLLPNVTYNTALQLLLSAFYLIYVFFFAFKPLKRIKENVQEYAETKNSEKVRSQLGEIHYKNEIGDLARGVSAMTEEIDSHLLEIQKITTEREHISAELNIARKIQADMLPNIFPPFPQISSFDIHATMRPAKEVGGDFYDFYMVDKTHVALVIADVSGKGVPAALFMVISKTMIKNRAMHGGTPGEILRNVNDQLCANNASDFFVTVWMAIIDIETGNGVSVNAGHEHTVIRRAGGSYELLRYQHSLPLAIMERTEFKDREFKLNPGDRIFVYTDGVPEATNQKDELFGTDRMLASLNQHSEASLQDVLPQLQDDIDIFAEGAMQFDDITMLVFDYRGESGEQIPET